jgi:hypothetical protein
MDFSQRTNFYFFAAVPVIVASLYALLCYQPFKKYQFYFRCHDYTHNLCLPEGNRILGDRTLPNLHIHRVGLSGSVENLMAREYRTTILAFVGAKTDVDKRLKVECEEQKHR